MHLVKRKQQSKKLSIVFCGKNKSCSTQKLTDAAIPSTHFEAFNHDKKGNKIPVIVKKIHVVLDKNNDVLGYEIRYGDLG